MGAGDFLFHFCGNIKDTDMLGAISWMQFLVFLFLGLVVYYGYVVWRFGLLREWFGGRHQGMSARVAGGAGDARGDTDMGGGVGQAAAVGQAESREEGHMVLRGEPEIEMQVGQQDASQRATVARENGVAAPRAAPWPLAPSWPQTPLPALDPPPESLALAEKGADDPGALSTDKLASPYGVQLPLGLVGEDNGAQDRAVEPVAEIDPVLFKEAAGVIGQVRDLVGEAAATQLGRVEFENRVAGLLAGHRQLWGTAAQVGIDNFLEKSCRMQLRFSLTQEEIRGLWGVAGAAETQ